MIKARPIAFLILLIAAAFGYFDAGAFLGPGYIAEHFPFRLGLDLKGGSHLVYRADVSSIVSSEVSDAMAGLRDVIERRVNLFGVTEPVVQTSSEQGENRLIVELAGITDVNEAIKMIGQTPFLEFRTERSEKERNEILEAQKENKRANEDPYFIPTELTGRYLKKATLNFDQTTLQPSVGLEFNSEGEKIFADLTKANVGRRLAIYLDGLPIEAPVVKEEIKSGKAEITGQFTPETARTLVRRLNSGALPLPIELISQQTVGASLGQEALNKGIWAGIYGILAVAAFLIFWYRLPGFVAVLALCVYTVIILFLFKIIPVTLTAAGIAGFILSVGMAVDANILIFERMKEEKRGGRALLAALHDGFARAWPSIRDSNISSLITSLILYWFGTSIIKGFALVLGIGILVSMFSAITVTRTFLFALRFKDGKLADFLFSSGLRRDPSPNSSQV